MLQLIWFETVMEFSAYSIDNCNIRVDYASRYIYIYPYKCLYIDMYSYPTGHRCGWQNMSLGFRGHGFEIALQFTKRIAQYWHLSSPSRSVLTTFIHTKNAFFLPRKNSIVSRTFEQFSGNINHCFVTHNHEETSVWSSKHMKALRLVTKRSWVGV